MSSFFIYNFNSAPHKINSLPKFLKFPALPQKQTILLISPHSDDISISCGGTVNLLAQKNKIIPLLLFTGYRGVRGQNKLQSTRMREQEMQKEARILKIKKPLFLRLKSYEKNNQTALKKDALKIQKYLKAFNPSIIFLPQKNDLQPRHKLAARIILQALNHSSFPCKEKLKLFYYETPWSIFNGFDFNASFVLLKKNFKQKIKAIQAHQSQLKRTPFDQASQSLAVLRASTVPEQRIGGYGSKALKLGNYMEVFKYTSLYSQNDL